jgi:hypothetical protein
MKNKLVVIINSLEVPKIKKILLYEIKFLVPNYSCLQNPWLEGYHPQIPTLSVLCPPPEQNSWVCHWRETNKLVVIINSLKVPKIKKILLCEIKFLVPNYSCLQNPWLEGYCPQIPILSVLCPPPEQNSWVRHWHKLYPVTYWYEASRSKFHVVSITSPVTGFDIVQYRKLIMTFQRNILSPSIDDRITSK